MQATPELDDAAIKKTEIVFGVLCLLVTPLYLFLQPFKQPGGPEFLLFILLDPAIVLGFTNIIGALLLVDGLRFFWKRRQK